MSRLWRFTPAIAATTAVVLLAAGLFLGLYIDNANEAQKIREASMQAHILASTASAALAFNDHQAAAEYLAAIRPIPRWSGSPSMDRMAGCSPASPAPRASRRPLCPLCDRPSLPTATSTC